VRREEKRREEKRREEMMSIPTQPIDLIFEKKNPSFFFTSSYARHSHTRIHLLGFVILLRPPRSILTGMNHRAKNVCNVKIK
jgi:hypothetical protein